jgi:hypothetical protein
MLWHVLGNLDVNTVPKTGRTGMHQMARHLAELALGLEKR